MEMGAIARLHVQRKRNSIQVVTEDRNNSLKNIDIFLKNFIKNCPLHNTQHIFQVCFF